MTQHFSENKSGAVVSTNLDAVITNTDGDKLETRDFKNLSAFFTISGSAASATATVNIEGSPNGLFAGEEITLDSTTYTYALDLSGGPIADIYSTSAHLPFTRSTVTALSGADVSVILTAGN